jgi:hypothetical protein
MDGGDDAVVRCLYAGPSLTSTLMVKCIDGSHVHGLSSSRPPKSVIYPQLRTHSFINTSTLYFHLVDSHTVIMHGRTLFLFASCVLPIIATPLPTENVSDKHVT